MEQQTSKYLVLAGIGALFFILGGLLTYALVTPMTSRDVAVVEQSTDTEEAFAYQYVAPENYAVIPRTYDSVIPLPEVDKAGTVPLETVLEARRSIKDFTDQPLTLQEAAQMLWAGIGITSDDGKRTAPSRGGENPTSLFLVAHNVEGLESGVYEYLEEEHALGVLRLGDMRDSWSDITHQPYPASAPAVAMVSGDMFKQYYRYGDMSERLVLQETGHIGQNMYLQANVLGISMLVMGGFEIDAAQAFLGLSSHELVLYLIPMGH